MDSLQVLKDPKILLGSSQLVKRATKNEKSELQGFSIGITFLPLFLGSWKMGAGGGARSWAFYFLLYF